MLMSTGFLTRRGGGRTLRRFAPLPFGSSNTGFAASFHFAQTAFGSFTKPGNVRRHWLYEGGCRMGTNKPKARELAVAWWNSDQGARSRARGFAICDSCNSRIAVGEGYLCNPAVVGVGGIPSAMFSSPDLVCESCFDRKSYEPWDPKQTARMIEEAQAASDLLASLGRQVGASKPKKKWWQFWK